MARSAFSPQRLRSPQLWCGAVGLFFLTQGIWGYVAPRHFFDTLATFEPYNEHFMRDASAFEMGIAVAGVMGALRVSAAVVGLSGLLVFQVLHVLSHVIDRHEGGRPWFDIPSLSLVAVFTAVALVWAVRDQASETSSTVSRAAGTGGA